MLNLILIPLLIIFHMWMLSQMKKKENVEDMPNFL